MIFNAFAFSLCVAVLASQEASCNLKQTLDSVPEDTSSVSLVQLKAKPSASPSGSRPDDVGADGKASHLKASIEKEKNKGLSSDYEPVILEDNEVDPKTAPQKNSSTGGPQWILISGHSEAEMSADPYYSLLRANKEWAAQSLGMYFKHYWIEDLLKNMTDYCKTHGCGANESEKTRHFAKIFMVQDAMRSHPEAEFILSMDSSDAWFNPRVLERFDNGKLMRDMAAQIPEEKHFIFAPVNDLGLGVFAVRNSVEGRQLVDQWAEIASGPKAPKCKPWDQAALYTLFLKVAAEHQKEKTSSEYNCRQSCHEAGCVTPFEEELRAFHLMKFSAGYQNNKVPFFHVLHPSKGVPRMQCVRCQHADGPVTPRSASVQTLVTPGEDALGLDVPWLINNGGTGPESRMLFARTSGMLQCDNPKERAQPSAIVAGVSKGGTTSIDMYLGEHPDVVLPETREVHFFDRGERLHDFWQHVQKQLDAVKKEGSGYGGFRGRAQHMCEQYFGRFQNGSRRLTLDSTPSYNFNPNAAEWIHYMFPNMKVILSIRDPATRAFSEWRMWNTLENRDKDHDMPRDSFYEAAHYGMKKVQPCLSALKDKKQQSDRFTSPLSGCVPRISGEQDISHGLYLMNLLPWMTNFPKKQVFILRFEDFEKDTAKEMLSMATFLGLNSEAKNFKGWKDVTRTAYGNSSSSHVQVPKESASDMHGQLDKAVLREQATSDEVQGLADLCAFYKEENEYLAAVLGMTLNWCGTKYGEETSTTNEAAGKALCRGLTDSACHRLWQTLRAQGWRQNSDLQQDEFVPTIWPESRESLWQMQLNSTLGAPRQDVYCPDFNGNLIQLQVNVAMKANRSIAEAFQEDLRCFGYPTAKATHA
mmetsp:Transcript_112256/g.194592  ORF Transcript_112256/g.194592 Transcript_112256/m.194592 type:complete len:870 (-) Transcript_112256:29-2638(-)